MKRNYLLASVFCWSIAAVSIVLGVSVWAGIGWCLGWLLGVPHTGVVCALVWYVICFAIAADQMSERMGSRIERAAEMFGQLMA